MRFEYVFMASAQLFKSAFHSMSFAIRICLFIAEWLLKRTCHAVPIAGDAELERQAGSIVHRILAMTASMLLPDNLSNFDNFERTHLDYQYRA